MTQTAARVHAPELRGAGGWVNTDVPLTLDRLRGRVVLLDFWTFCCINCLRVIEELRPIEHRFGDSLVVIGVHSPKFPHEADHDAVVRAVRRHRIEHPVLDDPGLETWQRYGVRAWPTLVVVDQDGYIAGMASGEGNGRAVGELVARLLEGRPAPPGPAFTVPAPAERHTLSFPGKVAADPTGERVAVADTGHDRVLVLTCDGTVLQELGDFEQPQGVRFDGDRLLICDTVGGRLAAASLADGEPITLAAGLRSPWDVIRRDGSTLVVAEAGTHRLLAVPAQGGEAVPLAGSGVEGLRDGPALQAHLAQPSGLTLLADGSIAFADSEVSALRVLRDSRVETLAGRGLFEWGAQDGSRGEARLQHPLGVVALSDGAIAVADTFNSRLRLWEGGELRTVALDTELEEPGGIDVLRDGRVLIADTNHHRVLVADLDTGRTQEISVQERSAPPGPSTAAILTGAPLAGAAGTALTLDGDLSLDREALDPSQGPPVRVKVAADPEWLLGAGPRSWALDSLPVQVTVPLGRPGRGTLHLDVIAATCHDDVCTVRRRTVSHDLQVG